MSMNNTTHTTAKELQMNGQEMVSLFNNKGMNLSAKTFLEFFEEEMGSETPAVGCVLILTCTELLFDSNNAEELKAQVLAEAEKRGEFAGMPYEPNAFIDSEDPDFESEDAGLSWVAFGDLWNALEKTANVFKAQEAYPV